MLQLVRQAGARPWDTVFAEDGGIFLQQARDDGLEVLFRGYAGYAQVGPRLLGELVALLPIEQAARGATALAVLTGALIAWFVWWAAFPTIRGRGERVALAASVAVAPPLVVEVTANITNTIWLLLFAAFWASASLRAGRGAAALRGGVALAAALSIALAALLLPVAAWRATFGRRSSADRAALVGLCVGLGIQALVVLSSQGDPMGRTYSAWELPGVFVVRVLGGWLLGDRWLPGAWDSLGVGLAVLLVVATLVIGGLLVRHREAGRRDRDVVVLFAVGTAVALYVVPMYLRGVPVGVDVGKPLVMGVGRFSAVPVLLLISATLALIDRMSNRVVRRAVLVQLAVVCALSLVGTNARSAGPSWAAGIRAATEACRSLAPEQQVVIPGTFTALVVRCEDLPV